MSNKRFELLMNAVDDDLLEEAHRPIKKNRRWACVAGSLAACLAVAIIAGTVFAPKEPAVSMGNPISESTAAEFEQLGYSMPVPDGAENAAYFLVNMDSETVPMAQLCFVSEGTDFTCRALKTESPTDISGIYAQWEENFVWEKDGFVVELSQTDEGISHMDWYDNGIQWSLAGGEDAVDLMKTAYGILNTLGYELDISPANATNVEYSTASEDGLEIGETKFTLNGVNYTYRMASTYEVEEFFADISGVDKVFGTETEGEVSYCPARIYFDEGGEGKIVWFDIAPGLLYSVHMDYGASEEALELMANIVFSPAQAFSGEESLEV